MSTPSSLPPAPAEEEEIREQVGITNGIEELNRQGVEHLTLLAYADGAHKFYRAVAEINRLQHAASDATEVAAALLQRNARRQGTENPDEEGDSLCLTVSQSIGQQTASTIDTNNSERSTEENNIHTPMSNNSNNNRNTPRIDSDDHNTFRVFDKAFLLSGRTVDGDPDDASGANALRHSSEQTRSIVLNDSTLARMASAVLYNAGLAHHLRGLANLPTQAFDYHRSLQFYLVSLRLLDVIEGDAERCRLLLLAIHNNMAHIHLHYFNTRSTTVCLNGLRQTLVMGEPCDEDSHFALNLLVSQDPEKRAAPTA
ncbi:hypothetical protein ACA910_012392 [Epithemia clementina (nom. ined.)]